MAYGKLFYVHQGKDFQTCLQDQRIKKRSMPINIDDAPANIEPTVEI